MKATRERRAKQLIKQDWIERMQLNKGYGGMIYATPRYKNNEEGA